ncbi:Dual oxidase [Araneus ventricosus]|uniref:Dual oxidase n=1 Tax=Araneus ventricosus TaxID=182803 RepID=A0A4Y2UGC2_ARAVE|nr:Dual oxidase [Araneus ventricosus]
MEPVSPYQGYQPDLHPGVSHVFQSAAFRFGHTLIPPGLYKRSAQCEFRKTMTGYPAVRLCSTWWDSEEVESGVEELLMGIASQIAEREDNVLCSDVRGEQPPNAG